MALPVSLTKALQTHVGFFSYSHWLELESNQLETHYRKKQWQRSKCPVRTVRELLVEYTQSFKTRSNEAKWVQSKNCEMAFTQAFQKMVSGACCQNQHSRYIVIIACTLTKKVEESGGSGIYSMWEKWHNAKLSILLKWPSLVWLSVSVTCIRAFSLHLFIWGLWLQKPPVFM